MKSEKIKVRDLDFFFMSLDEPNADKNYYDLVSKVPHAKRAKGIVGFDAVHRYCGEQSETDYLITIDADTIIDPSFLELEVDLEYYGAQNLCWSSVNEVNGLAYGNGGIKLWKKSFVSTLAYHELGSGNTVDFCWDDSYRSVPFVYSKTIINSNPFQAFRSGYREGVKLSLIRGQRFDIKGIDCLTPFNYRLLATWCTVGLDALYGKWAILGARLGLMDNLQDKFDLHLISSFEWLEERFKDITNVDKELEISNQLLSHYTPFELPILTPDQSKMVKRLTHYSLML